MDRRFSGKTAWCGVTLVLFCLIVGSGAASAAIQGRAELVSWRGEEDLVGKGNQLQPDGVKDIHFRLSLTAPGRTIKDIVVRSTNGTYSIWQATKTNYWRLAAVDRGRTVNPETGPLAIVPGDGPFTLDLYAQDNGSAAAGKTDYKIVVSFDDGSKAEFPLDRTARANKGAQPTAKAELVSWRSKEDFVGKGNQLQPDGVKDIHFRLSLTAPGRTIKDIVVRNTNGTYSIWQATKTNYWRLAAVDRGRTVNPETGPLAIVPGDGLFTMDLYAQDNGSAAAGKTNYKVVVHFVDGSKAEFPVDRAAQADAGAQPTARAELVRWRSLKDYVGRNNELKGDGVYDAHFRINLDALRRTVTDLEVRNANGTYSLWRATKTNNWRAAVIHNGRAINPAEGPLNLVVGDRAETIDVYVQDNGHIALGKTKYKAVVFFKDGSKAEFPFALSPGWDKGANPTAKAALVEWRSLKDYVGRNNELKGDGVNDARFGLDLNAPRRTVVNMEVRNIDGTYSLWRAVKNNNWRAAVVHKGRVINPAEGPLAQPTGEDSIPLEIYVQDAGPIAAGKTKYKVVVFFKDGSKAEFPFEPAPGWDKGANPTAKAELAEWRSLKDYVGRNNELKGDGVNDVRFSLDLNAPRRTVVNMEVRNVNGTYSLWRAVKSNNWRLAVTGGGRLLTKAEGALDLPTGEGELPLELFLQDGGSVEGGATQFKAVVYFKDQSKSEFIFTPAPRWDAGLKPEGALWLVAAESGWDRVGKNNDLKGDGVKDVQFGLQFSAARRTLIDLEVRNVTGTYTVWRAGKTNSWRLGVVKDGQLINPAEGPLDLALGGDPVRLDLFGQDNGSAAGGKTKYKAVLYFKDKTKAEFVQVDQPPVAPAAPVAPTPPPAPRPEPAPIAAPGGSGLKLVALQSAQRPGFCRPQRTADPQRLPGRPDDRGAQRAGQGRHRTGAEERGTVSSPSGTSSPTAATG